MADLTTAKINIDHRAKLGRLIRYFCDNCNQEMPTPAVGGTGPDGVFLYNGYNFPDKNIMVHLAYKPMNTIGLPIHCCPHCMIKFILERIGPLPTIKKGERIISNE